MAKAGFIFLIMAVAVPFTISRTTRYDKWHFELACIMYALSILGIAMIAIDE